MENYGFMTVRVHVYEFNCARNRRSLENASYLPWSVATCWLYIQTSCIHTL